MWTAEPRSRPPAGGRRAQGAHRAGERGFTFVEMAIVLAILGSVAIIVETTLSATAQTERYIEGVRRVTGRTQKMMYEVSDLVRTSRRLFERTEEGVAYLEALDLERDPRLPEARLPLIDEEGPLKPDDAETPRTGNMLLLIREGDALPVVIDPLTKETQLLESFRFVCVYPRQTSRRLANQPPARDLVVWWSVPFVSTRQIEALPDEKAREHAIRDLVGRHDVHTAWDTTALPATAFYGLDGIAARMEEMPIEEFRIPEDQALSDRGRLVYADLQLARTDATNHARRARMTHVDPTAVTPWVPDGFEVAIAGPPHAREVWLHLVIEAPILGSREVAVHEVTTIVYARDL